MNSRVNLLNQYKKTPDTIKVTNADNIPMNEDMVDDELEQLAVRIENLEKELSGKS